jgi:hypothetical protein
MVTQSSVRTFYHRDPVRGAHWRIGKGSNGAGDPLDALAHKRAGVECSGEIPGADFPALSTPSGAFLAPSRFMLLYAGAGILTRRLHY